MEIVLELSVLGAAALPALRLLAERAFRRATPRLAAALAALLAAYAFVLVIAAIKMPALLRPLALIACAAILADRWRARPTYGRSRGWPPGSLDILPVGQILDPDFYEKAARRHGPIFKSTQLHPAIDPPHRRLFIPMVCIVGLKRSRELLRRHEAALVSPPPPFVRFVPRGILRYMPPADHAVYRKKLALAIAPQLVRESEPRIRETVRRELAAWVEIGERMPERAFRPDPLIEKMVFTILVRLFFGISPGSERFERLAALYRVIDIRRPSFGGRRRIEAAIEEISTIVRGAVSGTDAGRPESFLGQLARAHPDAPDDATTMGNFIYLVHTTSSDVAGLLGWILKRLADDPKWIVRARADLDGVAERIVLETLRLSQSELIFRRAAESIQFEDFTIPKGWIVRLCVRESHRSAGVFADPDAFNPERFAGRAAGRSEFSPFGEPSHACLGEDLTMLVGVIFVEELARGFDWSVVADGPIEMRGWHWRPSSSFRVRATRI